MSRHLIGAARRDPRKVTVKQQVINLCGTRCMYCKEDFGQDITWHHLIPRSCGGRNTFENSSLLCQDCHRRIHSFSIDSPQFKEMTRKIKANKKRWMKG